MIQTIEEQIESFKSQRFINDQDFKTPDGKRRTLEEVHNIAKQRGGINEFSSQRERGNVAGTTEGTDRAALYWRYKALKETDPQEAMSFYRANKKALRKFVREAGE